MRSAVVIGTAGTTWTTKGRDGVTRGFSNHDGVPFHAGRASAGAAATGGLGRTACGRVEAARGSDRSPVNCPWLGRSEGWVLVEKESASLTVTSPAVTVACRLPSRGFSLAS